jgi:Protein of unknown function (DUF4012)
MARSRTAQRLRWALVLIGVAAVVLVAYTGRQALKAKDNLELVASDFQTLSGQLTTGDQAGATVTLAAAQGHARKARDNTTGPGWWLTSRIPGVGPNVVAVRTVADVADRLSARVLPDVVHATAALSPAKLRPVDGRIDLAPITAVTPAVVRASTQLSSESERVEDIDADALAPQIARPVRLLQKKLADATGLSDRASRAVRLLPPMLGANGKRTYLLVFQNNAELRSTGGIPGSFATVVADNGKVTIGRQDDSSTIGRFSKPPTPLTGQEQAVFGAQMGVFPQDVNFSPDFPRSARLISRMWEARYGATLDGVVSTDPVALSYLLRGTGPVALPNHSRLSSSEAVRLLLSEVYARIPDPAQQNVYFNAVARSVFSAVASGQGKPKPVLDNLVTSADQRRILLWSDRPAEQALLSPTRLGGALASTASRAPDVGVFLNDGGGSKLDYYLDYGVDVSSRRCQADRQYLDVTLHMRSRVPADPSGLPDYVARNVVGIPRGVIRTTLFVYVPVGGYLAGTTYDGQARDLTSLAHDGRTLVSETVDLVPGARHTLTYRMVTGKGQTDETDLRVTPGVHSDGVGTVGPSAC